MLDFSYHRPASPAEAARLAGEASGRRFLAGGHSLLPQLKSGKVAVSGLIDLSGLTELFAIETSADRITLGAMARHEDVARSAAVRAAAPGLAAVPASIEDPHVRLWGTVGGSVAQNDPRADYPAACLALDAAIVTDRRKIAAQDFFLAAGATALRTGEIVLAVEFAPAPVSAYVKIPDPAAGYALAGVFVARLGAAVRVSATGIGASGALRLPTFEAALTERFAPGALDGVALPGSGLVSDVHGSAEYRAHLAGVLARRAVAAALAHGDAR